MHLLRRKGLKHAKTLIAFTNELFARTVTIFAIGVLNEKE